MVLYYIVKCFLLQEITSSGQAHAKSSKVMVICEGRSGETCFSGKDEIVCYWYWI